MVDALASGASVLMDVEVQVLFWAPLHLKNPYLYSYCECPREVSYQINPKFRTKLVNITEVISTLSTKCLAQHAQLIHISLVEPTSAQHK